MLNYVPEDEPEKIELDPQDFDALVAETDEAAIRRTLLKLELDNTELGRALEVIKERKIAIQDLEDAERDIFDAKLDRLITQRAGNGS